ncbi:sensor domain-containing diguanylate cyclase [Maridesulfovibrio salexigens]|uniref:diguanylate cyclase n=1 Tax=Maridesulfovibrio salexigens (strain ATCC 14822 / DSM 2638 / NCIMB 8403 / VKM B-1763) TaxID=526222 RepID=C6BSU0_MARSD|nr:sensor domain-containing diguanylate cyclase [Maridesulfovibrio salexigens]ACS81546.1 diguanylate cyclase [Maridesulfovibrio salexigens DSM 2638]
MSIDKFDFDSTLLTVNFATRLLAMEVDPDILVDRVLEAFCDLGNCQDATLMMYDEYDQLKGIAASLQRRRFIIDEEIPLTKAMEEAAQSLKPVVRPVCDDSIYPLPSECCDTDKTCLCVPLVGSRDRIRGFVTLYRAKEQQWDISELFQLGIISTVAAISIENSRLFRQTIEDSLTGLYMRRYLFIRMREEIQRFKRRGGPLSVIMIDVDNFKNVNDTYGHATGDAVLRSVGHILHENSRQGVDIPCRYGGEEFVILMPGSEKREAEIVAERIRAACEDATISAPEGKIKITASCGIASVEECQEPSADALLNIADKRLYCAKESGRNRVVAR